MKKNIVIWANCQGNAINYMLNKYYKDIFNIQLYSNYKYIKNKIKLPDFMYECDIFIYQNYSDNNNEYNLINIFDNILSKKCIKLCFPTLHRNYLQFPFDTNNLEHKNTINDNLPFGEFFFGIKPIIDDLKILKANNYSNNEIKKIILDKIKDINYIKKDIIEKYENDTLIFLKNKSLTSDIPLIFNFIINNYKIIRLYHNPNHPNGILLNELCKEIFNKLNLIYPDEKNDIEILDNILKDWKMPIFNSVIKYYNMKNVDNNCSSFYHDDIKNEETYINKYIDFLLK